MTTTTLSKCERIVRTRDNVAIRTQCVAGQWNGQPTPAYPFSFAAQRPDDSRLDQNPMPPAANAAIGHRAGRSASWSGRSSTPSAKRRGLTHVLSSAGN